MKKKSILVATTLFLAFFIQMISAAEIKAVQHGSRIEVTIDGQIFTGYVFSVDEKFPFLFPINGPETGGSVTSMRNSDYPWHCSLFLACDMVNGGNYWYEGFERGQIVSKGATIAEQGDRVVITDECIWQRPGTDSPLKDSRRITITAPSKNIRQIDFEVVFEALTDVEIMKTGHSLFSARVAVDINGKNGGVIINAEGDRGEEATYGKRSAWIDYYGKRGNTMEGIAILQHPSNVAYPFPWWTREYGFFAPSAANWLPNNAASIKFSKGEKMALRYRVLIHAGDHKTADIAGQFAKYRTE